MHFQTDTHHRIFGEQTMKPQPRELYDLVGAMIKLDPQSRQWRNVISFILSCYACRALRYDLDDATAGLARLNEREQQVLIATILRHDARRSA
jgi:hypothetical protein